MTAHDWRSTGESLMSLPPQQLQQCSRCQRARRLVVYPDGRESVREWPYGSGLPDEECAPAPRINARPSPFGRDGACCGDGRCGMLAWCPTMAT
jgi:hypothetical protein